MCSESSSLGNSVDVAEGKSKVDASCKEVLANKTVLAKILQELCKEYKGMSLKEIEGLIEPPAVGSLPVDKDFTGQKINGMANEDSSNYEGLVKYDVRFKAKCPGENDEYNELIINVEAQGVFHPGYSLVTRGIYYASRMISAQNQIEFDHSHYDRIRKVYSIWVCLKPDAGWENTVTSYTIQEHNIIGNAKEKVFDYDKMNITLVCTQNESEVSDTIVGFLTALFSAQFTAEERKKILADRFSINTCDNDLGRRLDKMCDYGSYTWNEGEKAGFSKGEKSGFEKGQANGIKALVSTLKELGITSAAIVAKVAEKFGMTEDEARKEYEKYA